MKLHGASPWHLKEWCDFLCSRERESPRRKAVASVRASTQPRSGGSSPHHTCQMKKGRELIAHPFLCVFTVDLPGKRKFTTGESPRTLRAAHGVEISDTTKTTRKVALLSELALLLSPQKPEWRNWYTHQTQNLARSHSCRFESDLRHHPLSAENFKSYLPLVLKV